MAEFDLNLQSLLRFKLLSLLAAVTELEFAALRDELRVSDSVLSKQVSALAGIDYVRSRKGVHAGRRTTWISLTRTGRRALTEHITALRDTITRVDPHLR